MKLLRFGPAGRERPGLLDADGVIRDLGAVIGDLDPTTLTGAVYRECLGRYAEGVGLDAGSFPALRLVVWIVHSCSEDRRLAADAAGRPLDSALRGSLFLQLWEAELLRQQVSS